MNYHQILQKTRQEHVLFIVLLELTYRCNLDCFYCYNEKSLDGAPLTLSDYQRLLDDLYRLGTMNVSLSGGEPLAHPDFMAIGRYARDLGFVVRLKSNGHALDRHRAQRIKQEIDPFVIELSLHGATEATHDRQTRVPGSFNRLMQNVSEMKRLGLRLRMNCTLTAWNEHEIEEIYRLAEKLELPVQVDAQVTARDDGDTTPLAIKASDKAVRRLINKKNQLLEQELAHGTNKMAAVSGPEEQKNGSKHGYHCGAGVSSILVDPFGEVYPCANWRRSIGNIHEQRISDLWGDPGRLEHVRRGQKEAAGMINRLGPAARKINFCPGLAERLAGSSSALYADAKKRLALHLVD